MRPTLCCLLLLTMSLLLACEPLGEGETGGGASGEEGASASGESDAPQDLSDATGTEAGGQTSWQDQYLNEMGGGPSALVDWDNPDFFAAPFPSLGREQGGRIDLSGYPNPGAVALVNTYLAAVEESLNGFSPNQVIWFAFDGDLGLPALPSPLDSVDDESPVWLVDADPESGDFGQRHPIEAVYWGASLSVYAPDRLLAIRPLPGAPLREGGVYVAVVRRSLRDSSGRALSVPALLRDAVLGDGSGRMGAEMAPVRALAAKGHLNPYEVAVATAFRVGNVTSELAEVRQVVHELPAPELHSWKKLNPSATYSVVEARYEAPAFQRGEKPYTLSGGGLNLAIDGRITPVGTESMRLAFALPKGDPPPGGWPVALYGHGTGGDYLTFTREGPNSAAKRITDLKMVALSIDQPLHGARFTGPGDKDLLSFNVQNPEAGRTNFRQSAIDFMVLAALLNAGVQVPAEFTSTGEAQALNASRLVYLGHSHGGLAGAMLAAVEPSYRAVVLSGAGGGLTQTLMLRKDPYDFLELITLFVGEATSAAVTPMHPVIALVQMAVDVTDPLNYAPHLPTGALRGQSPMSVLLTEGLLDTATPAITSESLAAAARLAPVAPAVQVSASMQWAGLLPQPRPVEGNWPSLGGAPCTGALLQHADFGHFLIFDHTPTADAVATFLFTGTAGAGRVP